MNATFPGITLDRINPPSWLLADLPEGSGTSKAQMYQLWIEMLAVSFSRSDIATGHSERALHAAQYRVLIHEAVLRASGRCFFTGRELAWDLVRTAQDRVDRPALFPTISHDGIDEHGFPILQLVSMQVARLKSDLPLKVTFKTLVISLLRLPIRWWRSRQTERLRERVIREAYREPSHRERSRSFPPFSASFHAPTWSNH